MDPSSMPPSPPPPPATNTFPIPTFPAAVPFPPDPINNQPSHISNQNPAANHPPYAEMIYTAIEALKEKEGSSKTAIAKYIEQVYRDQLPPTHSALLTHHLNRLKNNGMLLMVKKSYMLPRSAPNATDAPNPIPSPRPRGRPRKAQVQSQPLLAPGGADIQPDGGADFYAAPQQQQNAEPVWAALGLADDPAPQAGSEIKRGPGRPKKNGLGGAAGTSTQSSPAVKTPGRRGRPPGSKSKKRQGRPPKSEAAGGAVPAEGSTIGPKRRPGRPPKNPQQANPVNFAPADSATDPAMPAVAVTTVPAGGDLAVVGGPRPRGRPKRFADDLSLAGRGRGRGRGRGAGRGRGTGRPVGRPRKGTTPASTSQNVANEELKRKLEHFQSKVRESLAALKPHFNHESPVTALAAIQELEILGTMDLNVPLVEETVPAPPPPQHLLPQQLQVQQPPLPPPPQQLQQQLPPPQQHLFHQQPFPQFNLQHYPHQSHQFQQLFHP